MTKKARGPSPKSLFYGGSFKRLASTSRNLDAFSREEKLYYVASLVFTGEIEKAQHMVSQFRDAADSVLESAFLFYSSLSYLRVSKYPEASSRARLLAGFLRGSPKNSKSAFYYHQAQAGLCFYKGDYKSSFAFSRKALSAAYLSRDPLLEIMALDLFAQSLIHLGKIKMGMRRLREALDKAVLHKVIAFESALRVSLLKYSVRFELNLRKNIKSLQVYGFSLNPEDHFSKNEMHLELLRQNILLGDFAAAEKMIREISEDIYGQKSQRQMARFNLICAHLAYLRGEYDHSLVCIQLAAQSIEASFDVPLQAQLLGLKIINYEKLSDKKKLKQCQRQMALLLKAKVPPYMHQRITDRLKNSQSSVGQGQDEFGDFLDEITRKPKNRFTSLLQQHLLGLIPSVFNLNLSKHYILLDPQSKKAIIATRRGVFETKETVTPVLYRLLASISVVPRSKEKLVKMIWKYDYHSIRHDPLFHSSMTRLRKLLQQGNLSVIQQDGFYSLDSNTELLWVNPFTEHEVVESSGLPKDSDSFPSLDLNHRQISMLRELGAQDFITVKKYQKKFNISHMTAFRDLKELCNKKLFVASGRGRARSYCKGQ